ncbi:hypothetical protein N665_1190s0001 [Sinapis alba]|nr:hypothetical protein N665_1190s0001 [Sinapis alba]
MKPRFPLSAISSTKGDSSPSRRLSSRNEDGDLFSGGSNAFLQCFLASLLKAVRFSSMLSCFPFKSCALLFNAFLLPFKKRQQTISFGNYEESISLSSSKANGTGTGDGGETGTQRRERRKWTHADDVLLISSWLNTSKDPVVSNEQRSGTFWSRVSAYFAASRQDGGCEREALHCKQRWHKINDLVCKFCGAYEAASREKTSGQNENDVLKLAHQIFYTNHKKKFFLEHAWKELRNDQKWCEASYAKVGGSGKKRKCEDGGESSTSQAGDIKRPPGVKASKGRVKKTVAEEHAMKEFEYMWSIRQQSLAQKERLSKMSLLDSLIAKKEPLLEYEEALKKKLINELLLS